MDAGRFLWILALGGLGGAVEVARADQLAWTSLENGRRAVAAIERSRLLVSYCSLCPAAAVEVWSVATATVAPTSTKGYYQVKISGRRIYRSKTTFDAGEYRAPVEYEPVEDELWDEGIDLAYAYVRSEGAGRFTSLCRSLGLECDVRTEQITLPSLLPLVPGVQAIPQSRPEPVQAIRVGGRIREPHKIKHVSPQYPDDAKETRVQGVVILECTIGLDGKVTRAQVLRGVPLLDSAAIEAVRQWVYEPTLLNGQPVPVIMTVTVHFRLE